MEFKGEKLVLVKEGDSLVVKPLGPKDVVTKDPTDFLPNSPIELNQNKPSDKPKSKFSTTLE